MPKIDEPDWDQPEWASVLSEAKRATSRGDSHFLSDRDVSGPEALVMLRRGAELALTADAGGLLTPRLAAELISRLDRGDDADSVTEWLVRILRNRQ